MSVDLDDKAASAVAWDAWLRSYSSGSWQGEHSRRASLPSHGSVRLAADPTTVGVEVDSPADSSHTCILILGTSAPSRPRMSRAWSSSSNSTSSSSGGVPGCEAEASFVKQGTSIPHYFSLSTRSLASSVALALSPSSRGRFAARAAADGSDHPRPFQSLEGHGHPFMSKRLTSLGPSASQDGCWRRSLTTSASDARLSTALSSVRPSLVLLLRRPSLGSADSLKDLWAPSRPSSLWSKTTPARS